MKLPTTKRINGEKRVALAYASGDRVDATWFPVASLRWLLTRPYVVSGQQRVSLIRFSR